MVILEVNEYKDMWHFLFPYVNHQQIGSVIADEPEYSTENDGSQKTGGDADSRQD